MVRRVVAFALAASCLIAATPAVAQGRAPRSPSDRQVDLRQGRLPDSLARIRDRDTPNSLFRTNLERIGTLLLAEATRSLRTVDGTVETPITTAPAKRLAVQPVIVPILRAGLGFVHAAQELMPSADIRFLGLSRDEETFEPKPDVTVILVTTTFAVLATVAAGLGPALKLSKTDLVVDLKALTTDGSPRLGRRFSGRNVMVVGQIALSLMLLSIAYIGGIATVRGAIFAGPVFAPGRLAFSTLHRRLRLGRPQAPAAR